MSTAYSKVFDKFYLITRDYDLDALAIEVKNELMTKYLNNSISRFKECKVSLEHDNTTQEFTETLNDAEAEILAYAIVPQWSQQFLYDVDNLERIEALGNVKVFSPANHIKEMRALVKFAKQEYGDLINDYEYDVDYFKSLLIKE